MRRILSLIDEDIMTIAACVSFVATGFCALNTRFDVIPSIALVISMFWFIAETNWE